MEWSERLAGKRLIFTVTSGRSGSHYLTRLLHYLPRMDVFHEESTHPYHEVLRATQEDPSIGVRFLTERKLPFIEKMEQTIFAETSHLFCKGFLEPLLDLGVVPDLILLSRNRRKIATSLFRLGTIPGRHKKALQFYLMPDDPNVVSGGNWHDWSDYQLCYWYVMEIERRQANYGKLITSLGGRVHACKLEKLTSYEGFRNLIREMQLGSPGLLNWAKFFWNKRKKAGDFNKVKSNRPLPEDLLNEEFEIEKIFHSKID